MSFKPVVVVDRDGRECLAGSAVEVENLKLRGYTLKTDPKPVAKAAESKPAAVKPAGDTK